MLTPTDEPRVGRLDEQRQAEAFAQFFKRESGAVGAGQGDERRHRQPGIAQQALGHVFIHADRRAEHAGADERHIGHAQQPLQRAVLPQRAVHDREDDVELAQRAGAARFNQLLFSRPGISATFLFERFSAISAGFSALSR